MQEVVGELGQVRVEFVDVDISSLLTCWWSTSDERMGNR